MRIWYVCPIWMLKSSVLNLEKQPILQNVNQKRIIIREMENCIIYYWTLASVCEEQGSMGSVKRVYD